MTRSEVAEKLGVSIATVRRLEGKSLNPKRASDGHWCFDPREVETVRSAVVRTRKAPPSRVGAPHGAADGELAARLFPLFEQGASFGQVVSETHTSPAAVRALFREWQLGYSQPVDRPSSDHADDEMPEIEADEEAFAAWETEVRALDREQRRVDRLARRSRRRRMRHF